MTPQVGIFFRRRRNPLRLGLVPTLLIGVALLGSGCASYAPRSLVIRPSAFQKVMRVWDSRTVDLRIVSFNVWGLPGWMNGASADRYPRIAQQFGRPTTSQGARGSRAASKRSEK